MKTLFDARVFILPWPFIFLLPPSVFFFFFNLLLCFIRNFGPQPTLPCHVSESRFYERRDNSSPLLLELLLLSLSMPFLLLP